MAGEHDTPARPRWRVQASPDETDAGEMIAGETDAALATDLGFPVVLTTLLRLRGIDTAELTRHFLEPTLDDLHDPSLLLGMAAAVQRIQHAVAHGEPILIYGDYDVDGTTATVLLKTAIERIATPERPAQVGYHVPHRLREGYGMQQTRLAQAAAEGIRLVISVDTGIRAFAAAEEARTLGLDLIVTDHHLPDGVEGLPEALAVINPAQPGCPYPNKNLCGAGVAFKLAHALLAGHATTERARHRLRDLLLPSFLKLVAIATIADSVALTGENRAIALLGLRALANPIQPGLRALMRVARLPLDRAPSAMEIGFRVAPRINAAGRMDVASEVVELLLTRDSAVADRLAERLDRLNQERRATEAAALDAIELQLTGLRGLPGSDAAGGYAAECLVLDHPEWHRGVLGILASRVVERTGRPALVLCSAGDEAHGSGRSIAGFHLLDALTSIHDQPPHASAGQPLFLRFGGHAHAVGFSLPVGRLPLLRARMTAHSAGALPTELLLPDLIADVALPTDGLTRDLTHWLERLEPFGMGNPEPLFAVHGLTLSAAPRIVKECHIAIPLGVSSDGLRLCALGWSRSGAANWVDRIAPLALVPGSRIDVIARLRHNANAQYGGLELELVDLRLATAKEPQPQL